MAKFIPDAAMDAALAVVAAGNILTVCSAQPTTRTEAITTYKLADIALTPGDGNGDFTIGNGDASGRKLAVAQQADIPIDTSGSATHIAICDGTDLLLVTTCTSQALTSGGTVTVPTFDYEIADVT
ncbi:MAG: hypothetical protein KF908_05180 [Nitrosomonas sp.]|nr:hypothetical protein [Nitrosomonas sp.]